MCGKAFQLRRVLSNHGYVRPGVAKNLRTQIAESSVSEDDGGLSCLYVDLFQNFKRSRERFDEYRSIVLYVFRQHVKIFLRHSHVIRKCTVVLQNTEHRSIRAVASAGWVRLTAFPRTAIDFTNHSLASELSRFRNADKLVAQDSLKSHVPLNQLQVGFTDARFDHANEDFSSNRPSLLPIRMEMIAFFSQNECTHV